VNNYRDLDSDEKVGKLTLVHYIHRPSARVLYVVMITYPYIILLFLLAYYSWFILLPLLCLPMAIQVIQLFLSLNISPKLNHVLAKTAQLQLIYSTLLSIAIIINSYSFTSL
jgi:1,4-dihydroxy-2-naphthoate octaprenyltransferase